MNPNEEEFCNIIIFNKYKTEAKLGQGNFNKIYRGVHIKNKNKVAIKLVLKII